jgi:hypothetical protein
MNGTATATGLNDMAAPHNPAPATITLMLNRSKIVINVNSFIYAHIFRNDVVPAKPHSRAEVMAGRPARLLAADVADKPRRTAPFPNGDVRNGLMPPEKHRIFNKNGRRQSRPRPLADGYREQHGKQSHSSRARRSARAGAV